MDKENTKKVLEKVSRLDDDLTRRSRRPVNMRSRTELDNMIANLGNPRMAEKLRIHKVVSQGSGFLLVISNLLQLVETEFNKIEQEVKLEVNKKMKQQKQYKKNNILAYKATKVIDKSKDFRQKEAKRKLNFAKQNESIIYPDVKERSVSFKEHIEHQKENRPQFKFEVLEKKPNSAKSALVVKNISR